ncbi:MAG: hypothetical protein N3A63_09115 [Bacteroidetes bacterium]|nr:hypothetical protein [Bacteroidota bacterium]
MFLLLRTKVGLTYARFRFRRYRDRAFRFTDALEHAHRVLIIFPAVQVDSTSVAFLFRYFLHRFTHENTFVLIREDLLFNLAPAPPVKTLTYSHTDVSRYFIPRKHLLSRLFLNTFDVVIDLNVQLHLPSAYVCKISNAPLRIGFLKPYADQFYNLQIQTRDRSYSESTYRSLLKCLDMF